MRPARLALGLATLCLSCQQPEAQEASLAAPSVNEGSERPTAILYPKPQPASPRIGVLATRVYVRARPRPGSAEIGALHLGNVVELRDTKASGVEGCGGGWLPIKPEGYVCNDKDVTRDVDSDPLLAALQHRGGDFDQPNPYRYAKSRFSPWYRRVPTVAEQRRSEGAHLDQLQRARSGKKPRALRGADTTIGNRPIPKMLRDGAWSPFATHHRHPERVRGGFVPARSSIAFVDELSAEGRSFLLTQEFSLVPKDRVDIQSPSAFRGLKLGQSVRLPLAFVRGQDSPVYRLSKSDLQPASVGGTLRGKVERTGNTWKRLSWVGLSGRVLSRGARRYLETREDGLFIEDDLRASVIRQHPPKSFELSQGEKWIDISIHRGTLVAYEGRQAVFATLISPGSSGYKRDVDGRPAKHATPTGTFRLEWKHRSTTMSPDPERKSYYLSEVAWTQFFHMPFALHAAYWHDRFGEPKSGGCVNLSPTDAKWLFEWTLPELPAGWHSVRSGAARGPGTWVRIR